MSLKKKALTCASLPHESKKCFGDEQGKFGMSACDPTRAVYNSEACMARTLGLSACFGDEVIASCGMESHLETLKEQAKTSFLMGLGSDDFFPQSFMEGATINEAPENTPSVITYALDDKTFGKYLTELGNMTVTDFHAELDYLLSEATNETQLSGLFDINAPQATTFPNETQPSGLFDTSVSQAMRSYQTSPSGRDLIAIHVVLAAVELIVDISIRVIEFIKESTAKREALTKTVVETCARELPDHCCVVIFDGIQHRVSGSYVTTSHSVVQPPVTFTFTLYTAHKSDPFIFHRQGDGGFINWSYTGNLIVQGSYLGTQTGLRGLRVYGDQNYGGWMEYLFPAARGFNMFTNRQSPFPWYLWQYHPKYQGPGFENDAISSFKLDSGVCAVAYENSDFQGKSIFQCVNKREVLYSLDVPDISFWDNRISSIIVFNPDMI